MHDVSSFRGFAKDLGLKILSVVAVVGVFFLLSFLRKNNIFGLSSVLDSSGVFLISGVGLIGFLAVSGVILSHYYLD